MNPDAVPKGGPAFPTDSASQVGSQTWHFEGMTLRDYFAAKAIEGATSGDGGLPDIKYCRLIAKRAYDLADAMLGARETT